MITKEQADELMALIGVYRTRSIRVAYVRAGKGAPSETAVRVLASAARARDELQCYIDSITVKEGG